MSTPAWKVYTAQGEYIAAIKYPEDAAALVAFEGTGASVRYDHKIIAWREGAEFDGSAGESYDHAASVMHGRVQAAHHATQERLRIARERFAGRHLEVEL